MAQKNSFTYPIRIGLPIIMVSVIVSLATPASNAGPVTTQPTGKSPVLSVHKVSVTSQPRVDAKLDDPAWHDASLISSLQLCIGPPAGMSATPTQVRLLWDDETLYIRFQCNDDDLFSSNGKSTNVSHSGGDVAEVFLDPVGDGRQFFEVQCNPDGGWFCQLHLLTTQSASGSDGLLNSDILKRDMWSIPNWELKGLRTAAGPYTEGSEHGWIADFALPAEPVLHRLALKKFEPMTMRANFVRYDSSHPQGSRSAKTIDMAWSPVVWGRPHRSPAAMGSVMLTDP